MTGGAGHPGARAPEAMARMACSTSAVEDSLVLSSVSPHLDHVFLTVDAKTYDDVVNCHFLKTELFGRFRIKTANSTLIGPYSTANVAGESTFVELFPDSAPPFEGIELGIVMSFDRVGESMVARHRLSEREIVPLHYELVRRTVDGDAEPQPWYHLLRPDFGEGSPFTLFLSEITPEYFARLGARPGPDGTQDRAAYLAAAMKAAQTPDHYLLDIAGVELRLRPDRARTLGETLKALGYQDLSATNGAASGTQRLRGPEAEIRIEADDQAAEGLLALDLAMTRPYPEPRCQFVFGQSSTLILSPDGHEDCSAIWQFGR